MPGKIPFGGPPRARSLAPRSHERRGDRVEAKRFYKSIPWRRLRAAILAEEPLCVDCLAAGRVTVATDVHHLLERRDRPDLALDPANLEPLCRPHHNGRRRGGLATPGPFPVVPSRPFPPFRTGGGGSESPGLRPAETAP